MPRSAPPPVDSSLPANTRPRPTGAWKRPWSPASGPPWKSCERWREPLHPTACPDAHSNRVDDTDGTIGGAVGRAALRYRLRGMSQPGASPRPSRRPAAREPAWPPGRSNRGLPVLRGLRESEWTWTLPTLLAWLSDPDTAIPNNAMNYVNALTAAESQQLAEWLLQQP